MEEAFKTFLSAVPRNFSYPYLEESNDFYDLLKKIFTKHYRDLVYKIKRIPKDTLIILEDLSESPEWQNRKAVVELIPYLSIKAAFPLLEKLSTDPDVLIRCIVAKILLQYPNKATIPLLVKLLNDPESTVRRTIVHHLPYLSHKNTLLLLKTFSTNAKTKIRKAITKTLSSSFDITIFPIV